MSLSYCGVPGRPPSVKTQWPHLTPSPLPCFPFSLVTPFRGLRPYSRGAPPLFPLPGTSRRSFCRPPSFSFNLKIVRQRLFLKNLWSSIPFSFRPCYWMSPWPCTTQRVAFSFFLTLRLVAGSLTRTGSRRHWRSPRDGWRHPWLCFPFPPFSPTENLLFRGRLGFGCCRRLAASLPSDRRTTV